ncbi:TrbI F-type domain-containing protein [Allochromatium humboldtianum]|uniref:TrbI F-type domain-containing protein n=1 Tax=Allochromatium humboldtianum TaxID=504901 RepID=A0A850RPU7_9GAMM|nr:TrbI F-type domain-containing protein [Allochromatium humboldtianum]NVZ11511.1 TrbI F-type domain-containing protein [Allochromatium humboldtianum]
MVKTEPTIPESIDSDAIEIAEPVTPTDASVPDESSHPARDFLVNLAVIIGLSAVTAAGVQHLMSSTLETPSRAPGLLMVDTERLAREAIDALGDLVAQNKLPSEDMPERSRQFSEGLLREIQAYAARGHVVLRSAAVLAAPAEVRDITDEVREQLLQQGLMDRKPETRREGY